MTEASPASRTYDVIVVGAGLAGAASAWSLARRGRSVLVLEQFAAGHEHGSSHGSARIVRRGYGDGLYVALTGQAFELWQDVERSSGTSLLRMLGGLDFGPDRDVPRVAALLAEHGVEHEVLPADEAGARWPGMRFEGDVVFHPQAGTVDAERAVATFLDLARDGGAEVRHETEAASVSPTGAVTLAGGEVVSADAVVVAAGAWVERLVGPTIELPPLRVTQQNVFHFERLDPTEPPWPSVIHEARTGPVYHLAGGRDGGPGDARKVAEHAGGVECAADRRSGEVDPSSQERVRSYVARWLPGLSPEPISSGTCLYTETPSEDFILDRIGAVVVCSPCSGHGAKFAPVIGELVAGCVDGSADPPARFRLASHLSGRTGSVSL